MSKDSEDSIENISPEAEDGDVEATPVVALGTLEGTVPVEPPIIEVTTGPTQPGERREIVRSATLVMLGNLGSSVMGMVRQIVVAAMGPVVSGSFLAALTPVQTFYTLLVDGSVSGALIPTFNDYATPDKRDELRRIVFTIVNLIVIITLLSSVAFIFIAPWLFDTFLAGGYGAGSKELTLQFARIIFFSLIALGPFSVLLAALYALKEFGWPAFATTSYHIGIIIGAIVGALLGQHFFGYYGLAFGVLLGSVGEIALLIPGMRTQRFGYMFAFDIKHPALRHILKLYAPVAFSFLVSMFFVFLDQTLATSTPCAAFMQGAKDCGEANFSAMKFATTLVQFPIGLVAAALSFAVLPTLTAHAREGNTERFKETLLLGFRLGLLLMIPAAAGLIALQLPIARLIFEHYKATVQESTLITMALQNYAYQLPFVAIDQLLISAFYARKNTMTPVVVGVMSYAGYLAVALPFWRTVGMPALALANTAQIALHAVILLVLLRMAIGPMRIRSTIPAVLKMLLATAALVVVALGAQFALEHARLFSLAHLSGQLLVVIVAGGLATAVYFGCTLLLKVEEVGLLKSVLLAKLGKK